MPVATTSIGATVPTFGQAVLEQPQVMTWPNGPRFVKNLAPKITQKSYICFSFDDGYQSIKEYSEIAESYGMVITAFLHSGLIDDPQGEFALPFLTSADVLAMHAAGHEIGGHASQNMDLRELTYAQCVSNFKAVSAFFEALIGGDYRCLTMAYPMNYHTATVRAAAEAVYLGARGGFIDAEVPLPPEMSPPLSHTPGLLAAYMVPKVTTVEALVKEVGGASSTEAQIRTKLRSALQTAINGGTFAIFGGHNTTNGTLAEVEIIMNEASLDTRFEVVTFKHLVQWSRERVARRDADIWEASYNRRFFWKTAAPTTFTIEDFTTGGPGNRPFRRITNNTGSVATYQFYTDTYVGEEMSVSCQVRGVVAGDPALVSNAVKLRNSGDDTAVQNAPATWALITHTRTPGALDDVNTGLELAASVTIDVADFQLEVGPVTAFCEPYPYATVV